MHVDAIVACGVIACLMSACSGVNSEVAYRTPTMNYVANDSIIRGEGDVCVMPIIDMVRDEKWQDRVGWASNTHIWYMEELTQYVQVEFVRAGFNVIRSKDECTDGVIKIVCSMIEAEGNDGFVPFVYLKYQASSTFECKIIKSSATILKEKYRTQAEGFTPYLPTTRRPLLGRVCARMSSQFAQELIADVTTVQ